MPSFLPDDNKLKNRESKWLALFEKYNTPEYDENGILIEFIGLSAEPDANDDDDDGCSDESVNLDEFESNEVEDDENPINSMHDLVEFDKEIKNEIAIRKANWKRKGITFRLSSVPFSENIFEWMRNNSFINFGQNSAVNIVKDSKTSVEEKEEETLNSRTRTKITTIVERVCISSASHHQFSSFMPHNAIQQRNIDDCKVVADKRFHPQHNRITKKKPTKKLSSWSVRQLSPNLIVNCKNGDLQKCITEPKKVAKVILFRLDNDVVDSYLAPQDKQSNENQLSESSKNANKKALVPFVGNNSSYPSNTSSDHSFYSLSSGSVDSTLDILNKTRLKLSMLEQSGMLSRENTLLLSPCAEKSILEDNHKNDLSPQKSYSLAKVNRTTNQVLSTDSEDSDMYTSFSPRKSKENAEENKNEYVLSPQKSYNSTQVNQISNRVPSADSENDSDWHSKLSPQKSKQKAIENKTPRKSTNPTKVKQTSNRVLSADSEDDSDWHPKLSPQKSKQKAIENKTPRKSTNPTKVKQTSNRVPSADSEDDSDWHPKLSPQKSKQKAIENKNDKFVSPQKFSNPTKKVNQTSNRVLSADSEDDSDHHTQFSPQKSKFPSNYRLSDSESEIENVEAKSQSTNCKSISMPTKSVRENGRVDHNDKGSNTVKIDESTKASKDTSESDDYSFENCKTVSANKMCQPKSCRKTTTKIVAQKQPKKIHLKVSKKDVKLSNVKSKSTETNLTIDISWSEEDCRPIKSIQTNTVPTVNSFEKSESANKKTLAEDNTIKSNLEINRKRKVTLKNKSDEPLRYDDLSSSKQFKFLSPKITSTKSRQNKLYKNLSLNSTEPNLNAHKSHNSPTSNEPDVLDLIARIPSRLAHNSSVSSNRSINDSIINHSLQGLALTFLNKSTSKIRSNDSGNNSINGQNYLDKKTAAADDQHDILDFL